MNWQPYKNIATKSCFEKAVSRWLPSPSILNIILLPTLRCMLNTSLNELCFPNSFCYLLYYYGQMGFLGGSEIKASTYNAGDLGLIPGSGRFPGEWNGNPLHYSCLEKKSHGWRSVVVQPMGSQRVGHDWVTSLSLSGNWNGALYQPRGVGWGGSFKSEWIYVCLWLIHVEVWQKTTKFCETIMLQLKNIFEKFF